MSATLLHSLFKHKAWIDDESLAGLEKLDPVAHQAQRHEAIRLFNHIYVVDRIFAAHLSGRQHAYTAANTPETPTLAELRGALAESDRWYLDYVGALAPPQLAESISFKFTDGKNGRMSREEMLGHVLTHGAYHRGAVGRILTQISMPLPRDVLTTFLHELQPERRIESP